MKRSYIACAVKLCYVFTLLPACNGLNCHVSLENGGMIGSSIFSSFNCHQVDVKKATPKPDGIGGLRGGRGARGGRGRGRGGRDSRVKGKGEQAGVTWKTKCFKLCTFSCVFF